MPIACSLVAWMIFVMDATVSNAVTSLAERRSGSNVCASVKIGEEASGFTSAWGNRGALVSALVEVGRGYYGRSRTPHF